MDEISWDRCENEDCGVVGTVSVCAYCRLKLCRVCLMHHECEEEAPLGAHLRDLRAEEDRLRELLGHVVSALDGGQPICPATLEEARSAAIMPPGG